MYLLPTVSIFYVQVGLCHIFRDYDGRWQISEVRRTRHEYYGTKSSFVLPLIFADEIIFIVIVPNHEMTKLAQLLLGHRATTHLSAKYQDVHPLANFNT